MSAPPIIQITFENEVDRYLTLFAQQEESRAINQELEARNALALTHFRLKLAQDPVYPDAQPPVYRELVTRWYARRRELALRWMFLQRVKQRAWMPTSPLYLPTQQAG